MTNLPVIGVLNHVVTVQNYLNATQAIKLPSQITSDPANSALVTSFTHWQRQLWSQFFQSLVNMQIISESLTINTMYGYGDAISVDDMQGICQQTLFQPELDTPIVSEGCVDMANLVAVGNGYVTQLDMLAKNIKGADVAQLKQIQSLVDTLNEQLSSEQEQFEEDTNGILLDSISTAINVSIDVGKMAAGDEAADPIQPLLEGVTKVGKDVVNSFKLTKQMSETIASLQQAWADLDEATAQLARMTMVVNQLDLVSSETSAALKALNVVSHEWIRVGDTANDNADAWTSDGYDAMKAWAQQMGRISFYSAPTMVVQLPS